MICLSHHNTCNVLPLLFSDQHETLLAVPGADALNPGDTMAVTADQRIENAKGTVEAVTVKDVMEGIPAPSYIIKTDIQYYDCKVIMILV